MAENDYDYSHLKDDTSDRNNLITVVTGLADKQQKTEEEIKVLKKELADKEELLREIKEHHMPDAFGTMTGTLELPDGRKVVMKETLRASLTEKNRDEGIKWLKKNGCRHVVTSSFNVEFPKGKQEDASNFEQMLLNKDVNIPFKKKETVHASTLQATVKDLINEERENGGTPVPRKLFGVYMQKKSEIK